jgi:hypothetical protein
MTNNKFTAMQSAWLEASTAEQGGESPNATDRGSFKCGFMMGANWAEGAMHEKVSELRHNLQIAIRALSEIADWSDGYLGKYAVQALRDMGVEE